jgi:hypothetical protein
MTQQQDLYRQTSSVASLFFEGALAHCMVLLSSITRKGTLRSKNNPWAAFGLAGKPLRLRYAVSAMFG